MLSAEQARKSLQQDARRSRKRSARGASLFCLAAKAITKYVDVSLSVLLLRSVDARLELAFPAGAGSYFPGANATGFLTFVSKNSGCRLEA